jgi:hypothetical protein
LEKKLLTDELGSLELKSDSLYVLDFYVTDCRTGDLSIYESPNLQEKTLKKKFNVKHIRFRPKEDQQWDSPDGETYKVKYYTYDRGPSLISSHFYTYFETTQFEHLTLNKDCSCRKEAKYYWVLFSWVKLFQDISLGGKCNELHQIQHFTASYP